MLQPLTPHEDCMNMCSLARSCEHECPRECHPPPCAPCKLMVQEKCNCGINTIFTPCALDTVHIILLEIKWPQNCSKWQAMSEEEKKLKLCCGNQCPKKLSCGHQCTLNCHLGPCSPTNECVKKEKVTCKCGRKSLKIQCREVNKIS